MQTRLLAILAALFAGVGLIAGCSSSEQSEAALPDATTLLQESSQATRDLQSVHLQLTVQGTIESLPVERLDGDLTNTPAVAAQGTADLLFAGQKIADARFVVADGDLYAALTPGDPLSNFGPAADIYDVSAILNPDTGLANVLANFSDAKADGRETINGVDTVRVTGNVSAEAVDKIAPQVGATGPVPGTAWITEDGDHALVQAKLEPSDGNSVTMTLSEWGKPVTVTKPAV
jgi:lipoprotein LprG